MHVNSDVFLHLVGNAWIVSNPRLRTHVELREPAVTALVRAGARSDIDEAEWRSILETCSGRDRTNRRIGEAGLVADHSGFSTADTGRWLAGDELFALLSRRRMLVADRDAALSLAKPLAGLLDRENLGTFHQRVGQYLLVDRRTKQPWREWQNQKFSPDGRSLLDTPYRRIQEPFFDGYFSADRVKDLRVLDFGCGNAYYTAKFAERGAHVTGVDNSPELLEIARANHGEKQGLELILTRSFEELLELMATWDEGSFDLIYLQDTLLLLLQPESGSPSNLLPDLFAGFRRLLQPSGTLCAMEPNPVFWLASRYGEPSGPYAVVTEYRHPVFNVAPTLDRVLGTMAEAGFALRELRNPAPAAAGDKDASGYEFEFPIWDFFVFVPMPASD